MDYYPVIKRNEVLIYNKTYIHLCSAGDGETVEFGVVEEERVWGQQMLQALVEFHQYKVVNIQQTVTIIDATQVVGLLRVITRTVRVRKRRRDGRVLPKARPNGVSPPSGHSSHLTTCRDSVIISHTISTLQCRKKCWRVLTTRVQENKVDQ